MKRPIFATLFLSALVLIRCGNDTQEITAQPESFIPPQVVSTSNCYKSRDNSAGNIVGDWFMVGMAREKMSEAECFEIDAIGITKGGAGNTTFYDDGRRTSHHGDYVSRCKYTLMQNNRVLHEYEIDHQLNRTIDFEVTRLDSQYLILVRLPDSPEDDTLSYLYLRK